MKNFSFSTAKLLINELGATARVGEICCRHGISNPLIVSDAGIVKLGMLALLEEALSKASLAYGVFTGVVADPPESVVLQAIRQATDGGHDGVIGFGGGSSMDVAKLVALLTRSGETLQDVFGVDKSKAQRIPLILVPTTAGTGSEVTPIAIVTTGETTKMGVVSAQLLPDVAILDAMLTVDLPPSVTAMTGIDAMVHATEAYTSALKKNLYSDMLAKQALALLSTNIMKATFSGRDMNARQAMLLGACLAGQAFANAPVAAVHALAYPLGGHYHLPHGLTNSLVLPHVLRFNASEAAADYADLAAIVLGNAHLADTPAVQCDQFINYFEALTVALELPSRLSALNVAKSDLPLLAREAMQQQRLLVNNPCLVTEPDALAIYQAAY